MSVPLSLSRHMTDSVTYERCIGVAGSGAKSFAAPVVYSRCRVTKSSKPIKDAQGQNAVSMTQVTVDQPITTLSVNDRVTLDDGTQPPIINFFVRKRSPVGSDMGNTVIFL